MVQVSTGREDDVYSRAAKSRQAYTLTKADSMLQQRIAETLSFLFLAAVFTPPLVAQAVKQEAGRNAFDEWDKNKDGFVSKDEFPSRFPDQRFAQVDTNQDGKISKMEDQAFRDRGTRARQAAPGRERQPLPQDLAAKVTSYRNLVYEKVGDRELPLDLYVPKKADGELPLVIWIHGGGWKGGSKNGIGSCVRVLEHGFALASVEYRLSGEAKFPAAIEDCKAAVSYLRLHAKKYGLNAEQIGVWGSSAGGHLVALLGTTNDSDVFNTHPVCKKASPRVQAVCNWFGPTDFLRMNDFPSTIDHDSPTSPESLFIGAPIQENKDLVARANPITYASESDPPMLLMHGDKDRLVAFNQSELLHAALMAAGVESELYKVVNGGHGFRNADDSRQELFERSLKFLLKHLKN